MVSWQGVIEFVAVVEHGGFTAAAGKLDVSVVHVSRKVTELEQRLGVKLLNRTTRKVAVTEAGSGYYEQCRHLVEGLEQAEQAVMQMQNTPRGLLKVTAPVTFGEQYIAPVVNRFIAMHPQLEVELVLTNQRLDLIDSGIDVAIRLGHLPDSSKVARRLGYRQLHVCASPGYLAAAGEPQLLTDLSDHQCLLGTLGLWRFKEAGKERNLKVAGRLKCNSGTALLDAALQGLGLVQLPDYYVRNGLNTGRLVEVLSQYRDDREGIWAIYPQNKHMLSKVRLFIDFLVEQGVTTNLTE